MSNCSADWDVLQKAIDHLSPVERLHLIQEVTRSLQPSCVVADPRQQRANLDGLRLELAAMPVHDPADGLSGRDHDRILYGDMR